MLFRSILRRRTRYQAPNHADLFRLDLEFYGVVNPPGPASPADYNPFQFGPSPVYGYIELDVDRDQDTGGEFTSAAKTKYLANVGRFGRLPQGSIGDRVIKFGADIDTNFFTEPFFERSGADFLLAFCGCYPTTIVDEISGNGDQTFDPGETWIVRGGFFQRAGGHQPACSSRGGAAGQQTGLYVPWVTLRWSHSQITNKTTITLVYALTMDGAGQLAGQPPEQPNLNVDDQTSVCEALRDLILGAPFLAPQTAPWYLSHRWAGRHASDYLDPTKWDATALFGTAYEEPSDGYTFAWTDTGFGEVPLDLNGDGVASVVDRQVIRDAIDQLDGGPFDAEGSAVENGSVRLVHPGLNFHLADVDGDGLICRFDLGAYCPADFNRDGVVNILDFIAFLNAYTTGDLRADFSGNGVLDPLDFPFFMNAVAVGCI